jgi:tetratricopeptide (TPR) repeat protein
MIIELVAGRLIARDLGSSLYTWTSIIGIVLAGITVGNYTGGRLADRYPAKKTIAVLLGLSSFACVTIIVLNNLVGDWVWLWQFNWPARVFSHVALVFLLPSALLGTTSPVVAKMALDKGLPSGRTVGDIYAFGTAGSIAGTFLAGFYLIATMGTITIIWTISGALLIIALLYWYRFWPLYVWAAILIAIMTMGMAPADWAAKNGATLKLRKDADSNVLYEAETPYCYVAVRRISTNPERREFIQDKLKHSEIQMDDVTKLQYFYTNIYAGVTHQMSKSKKKLSMMVIGGGGYAFPQYLEKNWPDSNIEVVEIDPGVTEAAFQAFGLSRDTSIKTISLDARNYVDQLLETEKTQGIKKRYDFIYEDAINDYSVPFQLVTHEFNEKILDILVDDGVYMINLIDTYDNAQFLGAVVNTVKKSFPFVKVATGAENMSNLRNTFVVIASKQEIDVEQLFMDHDNSLRIWHFDDSDMEYITEKSHAIVLLDDYAPVENLLTPVVKQSAKEILAKKYLAQAKEHKTNGESEQSIEKYRNALELNPSMSILAYNEIAMMYVSQKKLEEAAKAFQAAIDHNQSLDIKSRQNVIAAIHLNLGAVLARQGKKNEAVEQYNKAIKEYQIQIAESPDSHELYSRLGNTFAMIGDFKGAAQAFGKALKLYPVNPNYYDNMAKVLEYQGRFDEAIKVTSKQIELLKYLKQNQAVQQLQPYLNSLRY